MGTVKDGTRRSDIEFLSGLRGLAGFAVYLSHFLPALHPFLRSGYGQTPYSSILQLPFLRLIYSGKAMVTIFFVLSGLVLSRSTTDLITNGEYEKAFNSFASAIFKRAFRLYIPPIVATFLVMLACRAGLYDGPLLSKLHTSGPIRANSWREQFLDWISFVNEFLLNPWHWWAPAPKSTYGAHLWTITIFFSCSMSLFLTMLALSRLGRRTLTVATSILIVYNFAVDRVPLALSYYGMLLAHRDTPSMSAVRKHPA